MGVATALARSVVRGRVLALAALAGIVAAGLGVALASWEAADRTEHAYPDYLRRAGVNELVVNPGLATVEVAEILATTPGVRSVTSDDFLILTVDDGAPRTQAEVDNGTVQVRMSSDGRYTTSDRPVVLEGRMIAGGTEAFLSRETADELGVEVGDELPLAFWVPSYNTPGVAAAQEDLVESIGRSSATVVGIGVFADEVLPDGLYPRQRLLISPEVGERFTCTLRAPDAGDPRPIEELFAVVVPPDCALAYRYFSLDLEDGEAGVDPVTDALVARLDEANQHLPLGLREADVGYVVIPSATRDERVRLEDSLRPAVTALRLFALAAALSTIAVAALAALRLARRDQAAVATWRQLGVTRPQSLSAVAGPLMAAGVVGLAGAAAIGYLASGLGPVASARTLVPDPSLGLSASTLGAVGGSAAGLLLVAVTVAAGAVALRRQAPRARRPSVAAGVARALHPVRALGVRAAVSGPGAGSVVAGSVASLGAVLAVLVFSTSLSGLVDRPANYGWPYDAAVMVGFGYGGAELDAVEESLDRPEVEAWGVAQLGPVTIEGETVAGVGDFRGFGDLPLAVSEGRYPDGADDIALGVKTAEDLGVEVGDQVDLVSSFGERRVRVVGTVVLPPVGPFESDRAASGEGALLSERLLAAMARRAEEAEGLAPGSLSGSLGAFVAIDLRDGVDPAAFFDDLGDLRRWDVNGFYVFTYTDAVRPASIADIDSMRRVPLALGGFLAAAMALGLGVSLAVASRGRRRELALLGAFGCGPRQLAASVRWHSLAVVAVAVVVGGPAGIALGRTLYRVFADDLGVVGAPVVSVPAVAGVLAATLLVALAAALAPARAAARRRPAEVLRTP